MRLQRRCTTCNLLLYHTILLSTYPSPHLPPSPLPSKHLPPTHPPPPGLHERKVVQGRQRLHQRRHIGHQLQRPRQRQLGLAGARIDTLLCGRHAWERLEDRLWLCTPDLFAMRQARWAHQLDAEPTGAYKTRHSLTTSATNHGTFLLSDRQCAAWLP